MVEGKWLDLERLMFYRFSDRSFKRIVSGGRHTADTIHLEKRAAIHSSIH